MSFPIGRMYLLISVMSLGLYVTVGTSSGSMHGAVNGRQPPNRDSSAICNEKKITATCKLLLRSAMPFRTRIIAVAICEISINRKTERTNYVVQNKNVDIKSSAHDVFLEPPSTNKFKSKLGTVYP
jgi:hypothetical protein